jgi:hypothetical protein
MSARTAKKLSPTDLSRHKRMMRLVDEARALQQQIDALSGRQGELLGAFKLWSEELHERYGLALDGSEGVNMDGSITRAAN